MKKKRKTREWIKWATHEALKVKLRKVEESLEHMRGQWAETIEDHVAAECRVKERDLVIEALERQLKELKEARVQAVNRRQELEDSNARLNEVIQSLEQDGQSAAKTIETLRVMVDELTWERNGLRVEVNRETRDRQLAMDLARMVAEALGPKKAEGK